MRHVVIKLGRLALSLLLLYGALLALACLLVPREPSTRPIDTARAAETLYLTEPKYVFMARQRLQREAPKVLLLGASNTMAGFKQRELQPLLPEVEVHNLAVGGANLTEVRQVAELVREVQTPEARRGTSYVVGLWYGLFASDTARWNTVDRHPGDTDMDIERYRYGFYRRTPGGAQPLLPPRYLSAAETLVWPYLALDRLARDLTVSVRAQLSGKAPKLTDEQRNARVISVDEQRKYLAFWRGYMGAEPRISDHQLEQLSALVDTLVADGSRVVLVDMPIPRWHAQGAALALDYTERMRQLAPELSARAGVTWLSMTGTGSDDDFDDDQFSDEVHPKPRVSSRWAARLADALRMLPVNVSATNPTASNDHG
jgi:hypothetical protein